MPAASQLWHRTCCVQWPLSPGRPSKCGVQTQKSTARESGVSQTQSSSQVCLPAEAVCALHAPQSPRGFSLPAPGTLICTVAAGVATTTVPPFVTWSLPPHWKAGGASTVRTPLTAGDLPRTRAGEWGQTSRHGQPPSRCSLLHVTPLPWSLCTSA